ncbi:hypothetical protein [Actinomadura harenae]|uniref:hypothetical protein n=1 Tax=Actinomadura harenae TaxID=2483351 RepID=UPI0011C3C336|nr:hypothetical protein [Actinomadura harenae]
MTEITKDGDAMRRAAQHLADSAGMWALSSSELNGAKLGQDDLGYLGRIAEIPKKYNEIIEAVWYKIDNGRNVLAISAANLKVTANNYDHAEDKNVNLMPKHIQ